MFRAHVDHGVVTIQRFLLLSIMSHKVFLDWQNCDERECRHASNAVDGEIFAVPGQLPPVAAETEEEDVSEGGPWWEVELGGEYDIVAVDVTAALNFYPPSHYPQVSGSSLELIIRVTVSPSLTAACAC